jgi:hypothetical protein
MRQLVLKKKESHLAWEILVRGLVATDRLSRKMSQDERHAYEHLRQKLVAAWRGGIIVGGVRPKKDIVNIMPRQMLLDTGLPAFRKSVNKARAEAKGHLVVPHRKQRA